jgi:hypothetical protein
VAHADPIIQYMKQEKTADFIGCCNNTEEKKSLYTDAKYGHSNTEYIDTLLPTNLKFSEVRTTTLNFGMIGSFVLNFLHRKLPEKELLLRGGDKVKIMGITSC